MSKKGTGKYSKALFLIPRVLSILYIFFLGLFALDVFDGESTLLQQIGGFLIHLMPNFLLLGVLAIAWKKERMGGILFLLISLLSWFYVNNVFWVKMLLFGPIGLIGILLLVDYYYNHERDEKI